MRGSTDYAQKGSAGSRRARASLSSASASVSLLPRLDTVLRYPAFYEHAGHAAEGTGTAGRADLPLSSASRTTSLPTSASGAVPLTIRPLLGLLLKCGLPWQESIYDRDAQSALFKASFILVRREEALPRASLCRCGGRIDRVPAFLLASLSPGQSTDVPSSCLPLALSLSLSFLTPRPEQRSPEFSVSSFFAYTTAGSRPSSILFASIPSP